MAVRRGPALLHDPEADRRLQPSAAHALLAALGGVAIDALVQFFLVDALADALKSAGTADDGKKGDKKSEDKKKAKAAADKKKAAAETQFGKKKKKKGGNLLEELDEARTALIESIASSKEAFLDAVSSKRMMSTRMLIAIGLERGFGWQ